MELGARFSNTLYFLPFTALLLHKYITVDFYSWKFLSDQMGFCSFLYNYAKAATRF